MSTATVIGLGLVLLVIFAELYSMRSIIMRIYSLIEHNQEQAKEINKMKWEVEDLKESISELITILEKSKFSTDEYYILKRIQDRYGRINGGGV